MFRYCTAEYQKAIEFYEQWLTISRSICYRHGEAIALNNLGEAYHYLGNYQRAIGYFQQSLSFFKEMNTRALEAESLYNLGLALAKLDRKLEAFDAYENARRLFESMKLEHWIKKCDDAIRDLEM